MHVQAVLEEILPLFTVRLWFGMGTGRFDQDTFSMGGGKKKPGL